MFTVTGIYAGVAYGVGLGPRALEAESRWGQACGSRRILALLAAHEGEPVKVTPTGPEVVVKRDDPVSLLGALYALTDVVAVEGEGIPVVIPPLPTGATG